MVRFSDIIKVKDKQLPAGKILEKGDEEDRIESSDLQTPDIPEEKKFVPEIPSRNNIQSEVISYYGRFIQRASDVRKRVKSLQGISPSPILSDLHHIIMKELIDELYEYAASAHEDHDDMLIHTIDVTFTSLMVGKGMRYDLKSMLRLGLAAFLENVGMYKIPDSILKKRGELGKREIELIKKHPEMSYEILSSLGTRYRWLAKVALQIHERSDGSGYPSGLKGDEIEESASIIGLVDSYMAMIKNRPYREKFMQTDAIKSIVETSKGLFPPRIVRVFLNQISLFPVNSYIKLNNGSIGRVISTDKNQPLRPTIELLYDVSGGKLKERQIIPLSENPLLYIDSIVSTKELL